MPKLKHLPLVEELIKFKIKPKNKSRISWAELLKRVFNIDVSRCNKCSVKMKITAATAAAERSCTGSHAAIEDHKVIRKILSHLGLPTNAPKSWPAREPPAQLNDYKQF
jgi:hypothetical protein